MAYLRRCYSAPCRTFADQTGRPNRINWYWAPEGAAVYEEMHTFWPRIDDLDTDPDGLYEFTAKRTNNRRYTVGRNRWGTTGDHVHGDAQDFLGESLSTRYMIGGRPPQHPCNGLLIHFADFYIGALTMFSTGRRPVVGAGFSIGAVAYSPAASITSGAGFSIGAATIETVDSYTLGAGFVVGAVATVPVEGITLGAGFVVGAVGIEEPAVVGAGFAIGAVTIETGDSYTLGAGFVVGAVGIVPVEGITLGAGFTVGGLTIEEPIVLGAGFMVGGLTIAEPIVLGAGFTVGGLTIAEPTRRGAGFTIGAVAI